MTDVNIDPRYLKYNKADVERLLGEVENTTLATEEGVRGIVSGYLSKAEANDGTEVNDEPEGEGQDGG